MHANFQASSFTGVEGEWGDRWMDMGRQAFLNDTVICPINVCLIKFAYSSSPNASSPTIQVRKLYKYANNVLQTHWTTNYELVQWVCRLGYNLTSLWTFGQTCMVGELDWANLHGWRTWLGKLVVGKLALGERS